MIVEVRPGESIGPFVLGMSRVEVVAAAAQIGLDLHEFQHPTAPRPSMQIGGQINVHFDDAERLLEIEAATPSDPSDARVMWGSIDLGRSALEVARRLDELAEPDRSHPEFPGSRAYDSLGLALWQDAKPGQLADGPYEAVLVRRAAFGLP